MLIEEVTDHGIDFAKGAEGYVRSAGLHMSDIYNALYKKLDPDRYDKRDINGDAVPFDLQKLEFGLRFEEMLERVLALSVLGERPGEFRTQHDPECPAAATKMPEGLFCPHCLAGTYYSPDYLFYEPEPEPVLGEFKLTWYSSKGAPNVPEKFDKYFTQIKAYLYHLRLRRARLYVFFVNGKYPRGGPPTPEFRVWKMQFTERELHDEWKMLRRFALKEGVKPHGSHEISDGDQPVARLHVERTWPQPLDGHSVEDFGRDHEGDRDSARLRLEGRRVFGGRG